MITAEILGTYRLQVASVIFLLLPVAILNAKLLRQQLCGGLHGLIIIIREV